MEMLENISYTTTSYGGGTLWAIFVAIFSLSIPTVTWSSQVEHRGSPLRFAQRKQAFRSERSAVAKRLFTPRQPKLQPEIQQLLNSAKTEQHIKAWVLFTDKSIPDESPRKWTRERDDDVSDLPVRQRYIHEVLRIGGTLRCVSRWFNAISIEASLSMLERIQHLPFVRAIDLVVAFRAGVGASKLHLSNANIAPAQVGDLQQKEDELNYGTSSAQIRQIKLDRLHKRGYHGEGIIIGLLDTGFDLSHEAVKHADVIAEWDVVNNDDNTADEPGQDDKNQDEHGSVVLSILAGYSPGRLIGSAYKARYLLCKTEKVTENGREFERIIEEDWWIAGLEWMESAGVDVVNSSVGYADWYRFADLDGKTAKITIAADMAADKGIVMVVAAGNGGNRPLGDIGIPGRINVPADGFKVLAVGAVDATGRGADFSAHGPTFDGRIKPDVVAMGKGVTSVRTGTIGGFSVNASGTSVATPLATGVVALLRQAFPQTSPADIIQSLKKTASNSEHPNNTLGWGIINAESAYNFLLERFGDTVVVIESDVYKPISWGKVKQKATLAQNYPNPFNSETWIPFRLTSSAYVTIKIFDVIGKLVYTMRLGYLPAGDYLNKRTAAHWNEQISLASGMYFYKIEADEFTQTRRMLLMK